MFTSELTPSIVPTGYSDDCKRTRLLQDNIYGHGGVASTPPGLSRPELDVVLNDFIELHRQSFLLAIAYLQRSLYPRDINPDTDALHFTLECRPDSDGNPATRLFIDKIEVVRKTHGAAERDKQKESTCHDSHRNGTKAIGTLTLSFRLGEATSHLDLLLEHITVMEAAELDQCHPDWVLNLRFVTTVGLIFDKCDSGAVSAVGGMMNLDEKGRTWRWEEVSQRYWSGLWQARWRHMGPTPEVSMGHIQVPSRANHWC